MANVRLVNVRKVYEGGVAAIRNFNVEVKDREFVVLVGPSGCGKSTILRMIAGLEQVTEGEVFIDDQLVNDVAPKDRDIAMVFQNYALYPHMTVYENLAFGLKLRRLAKDEIKERVREAAAILGIEEHLSRKPKALSGGERQRVAVGRAIVRKPKVFLFDEPLSNLDAKLRVQMRTEITKLHHRLNATMIYVTHDQTEAMTMADKIVLIKDGCVQQIETPLQMYNHPVNKFVASFIGSPAMNFFEGTIERSGGLIFVEKQSRQSWPVSPKDGKRLLPRIRQELVFGLRPEHISVARIGSADRMKAKVETEVEVVEPMGNEIYLYFNAAPRGRQYVARIGVDQTPRVGSSITLAFDMSKAHFFDAKTEETL